MSMRRKPQDDVSARPWTYHAPRYPGGEDWIEDARGQVVLENVGVKDGPFLVAAVNRISAFDQKQTRECPQCRQLYSRNYFCCTNCDVALRPLQVEKVAS